MATKKTTKKAEEVKAVKEEVKAAPKAEKKVEKKVAPKAEKKVEKAVKETAKKEAKAAKEVAKKETKAAKKPAKKVEKALLAASVKGLFFEYGDKQVDAASLAELAKASYKENGGKATVKSLELYVKAEDNALYYVVNGKDSGKVEL